MNRERTILLLLLGLTLLATPASAFQALNPGGHYTGDPEALPPVDVTLLPVADRAAVGRLVIQDYQGRMMPLDTYSRALIRKTSKTFTLPGWEPGDLLLSWLANPQYWWDQPLLYVRYPGLKDLLGVEAATSHVTPRSLFDERGQYLLIEAVQEAHRTSDRDRTKTQRKLISFDERLNLLYLALTGRSLRVFPVPGDDNNTWLGPDDAINRVSGQDRSDVQILWRGFLGGLQSGRADQFGEAVRGLASLQARHGQAVLPRKAALDSELFLNQWRPFSRLLWGYLLASLALMTAYFIGLIKRDGRAYNWLNPLFIPGFAIFCATTVLHLVAYVMRWLASGRAPLSNGYESLIFISLIIALTGVVLEFRNRRAVLSGLSALLTFVVLGIAMMSFFDPAIGLLVPVLNSYWLNIHVTVITASYGVLGLGALMGALMLVLYLFKRPGRLALRDSIRQLDKLLFEVIILGLGLLTIGTLLGGVWANESWGRYWGWDPKETWSLVTILAYIVVSHIRIIPGIRNPWNLAAGSFAGIACVVMTFFGVNYFLSGLHSYASSEPVVVPAWVYTGALLMVVLIVVSGLTARKRVWVAVLGDDLSNSVTGTTEESS